MARIAKSLEKLRAQINEIYPNRSKISDGWIGDAAHAARKSDHNPNSAGVVQALDITHDPRPGVGPDTWKLAEILRLNQDSRIKYVISNGRIFSSSTAPWVWRNYTGSNKHDKHIHVSVGDSASVYDNDADWDLTPPEVTAPPPVALDVVRQEMGKRIVEFEARYVNGKIAAYTPSDGSVEVAGINSTYHKPETDALMALINAGKHKEAEERAAEYIIDYTDPVVGWTTHPGLEFFLRDSFFNRGPTGSAIILQKALGVEEDGQVGPLTRSAVQREDPDKLLLALREARETYELEKYGRRENVWKGLENRWNKALSTAQAFAAAAKPAPEPTPEPKPVPVPTPEPAPKPPAPVPSPFVDGIEAKVAEIRVEKDKVAAAITRLRVLADELKALIDKGVTT